MIKTNTSSMRTVILMTTLAPGLFGAAGGNALAQGKDMGCSPTVANPCTSSPSSGSRRSAPSSPRSDSAEEARQQRRSEAHAANNRAIAFQKQGEHAKAVAAFQEAADKAPDDEIIRKNLANAKTWLEHQLAEEKAEREAAEAKRRDKAAADNMQQSIQDFTKTLKAAPTSGGLDFDGINPGGAPSGGKSDGLDFTTNTDASVVDLRDAKTLTVDPSRVKGTIAAAARPSLPTIAFMKKSMGDLARTLRWSAKEQARLAKALKDLGEDGNPDATLRQVDETWARMQAREDDPVFAREAAKVNGVGFPGAGVQSTNDCTIFALANSTGQTYGGAAARATKLISEGGWRDPSERANPAIVFKKGLYSHEVIMLAEAFGQVEVVPSSAFTATLKEGRPILLSVSVTETEEDEYREYFHEVVLTKSFQYKGETWFEMMDSNQPANARRYLSAKELGVIMVEKGVAFRPDAGITPKLLR